MRNEERRKKHIINLIKYFEHTRRQENERERGKMRKKYYYF
jgi:hypothetical protein